MIITPIVFNQFICFLLTEQLIERYTKLYVYFIYTGKKMFLHNGHPG